MKRKTTAYALATILSLTIVGLTSYAGLVSINAHAMNGTSDYDDLDVMVPAGAWCSYFLYSFPTSGGSGSASVSISGPGVSISDTVNSPDTDSGGGNFTSSGRVLAWVSAQTTPGAVAEAGVTVEW